MYIDMSFPRPSSSPRLGILVHWLPIDSVLLTEPLYILLYIQLYNRLKHPDIDIKKEIYIGINK